MHKGERYKVIQYIFSVLYYNLIINQQMGKVIFASIFQGKTEEYLVHNYCLSKKSDYLSFKILKPKIYLSFDNFFHVFIV